MARVAMAVRALGGAARGLAEVFVPDASRRQELAHEAYRIAHDAQAAEFRHARSGLFDRVVNGLNRLPRPVLALGTLGLFVYAMVDPAGFAVRMRGLAEVPEPLWWLLGAVVSFYFGAREAHYFRMRAPAAPAPAAPLRAPLAATGPGGDGAPEVLADAPNPALEAWRAAAR